MGESDGGVLLDVKLNPEDPAKEFDRLSKKAAGIEDKLAQAKQALSLATNEASKLGKEFDTENSKLQALLDKQAKLSEMVENPKVSTMSYTGLSDPKKALEAVYKERDSYTPMIEAQRAKVEEISAAWEKSKTIVDKNTAAVEKTNAELTSTKTRAAQVAQEMGNGGSALSKMGIYAEKVENRLKRLAVRVLVFSVFTSTLRNLRSWFADVIKTDKDAVGAIAQLKGALLTLIQPLVGVVIPAFTTFVQVLAQVVGALATVTAAIFGTTLEESAEAAENLDDEKKALDGVSASAKKAGKSMASFDEINKLGGDTTGGAGASSKQTEIEPDFSFLDGASERLQELANLVLLVGLGIAAWKMSDTFSGGLMTFLGLLLAIQSATLLSKNIWDAWENGFSLSNLIGAVAGAIGVVVGLQMAFGNVGGAAGLLVSGLMILITAIKDICENGLTLENGLAAVVGVLMTCWGIGKLVGASFSEIAAAALVVATGLAMLVLAFQDAIANGWNLENTLTAVAGIILTGLGISLLVGSWIPALIAGILALLLAITTLTGNGEELIENLMLVFSGLIEFITGVFTGDWERAWNGIKDVFKGLWNSIVILLESAVNLIIKGLNWLISKINSISFEVPDWVPGIGGESIGPNIPSISEIQLPRLATGAVIPANREFAAVLGDQTHGNNLEGPEALFRQIVREESGAGGDISRVISILQQILEAIKEGKIMMVDYDVFARIVHEANNSEGSRTGVALVNMG